jgi:SAM-dependent methyltransferase
LTKRVAERFHWAVEVMDPAPSDRLLEIGCGQGVAVSLICPLLSGGAIVAIDRSQGMIDRALRRNRRCVEEGRASFEVVALEDAQFPIRPFDKAFAINVRLFRTGAGREAEVLRSVLKPTGLLFLFQHHPSAHRTRAVTEELQSALTDAGFAIRTQMSKGSGASTVTCIVAQPPRPGPRR